MMERAADVVGRIAAVPPAGEAMMDRALRRPVVALIAFLTVVDLFAAQALLPSLVVHYGVSPAAMGLAVNACTLGMALGGVIIACYGHRIARRTGIAWCLLLLTLPTLGLAFASDIYVFATLRIVQGIFMSAAFGLTLAHIGEAEAREHLAGAFAAYITGNVASNLGGRLLAASVVESAGLAASFSVFAGLNALGALLALVVVRPDADLRSNPPAGFRKGTLRGLLGSPGIGAAFAIGFAILFVFIGIFTYINFVLVRPPLGLSMMRLGAVYFVFLPAIVTTPLAGRVTANWGTRAALWSGLAMAGAGLPFLLSGHLTAVMAGMILVGVGTFFAQAVATGYVSRAAGDNRTAAGGFYLASYFAGGLAGAAIIGQIFDAFGWTACIAAIALVLALASVLAARLRD